MSSISPRLKLKFGERSPDSKTLTGDVLAGTWQYMNQPWSSFRETLFDIVLDGDRWNYIGFGRFASYIPVPPPPPPEPSSSLSRSTSLALNQIE